MNRRLNRGLARPALVIALTLVLAACGGNMPKMPDMPKLPAALGGSPDSTSDSPASRSGGEESDRAAAESTRLYSAPRSTSEKKLDMSSTRFHEVMLSETMEQVGIGAFKALALCFQRYPRNESYRKRCMQNAVLGVTVQSVQGGYDLALRDEQERRRVSALQVIAENMKRDNDELQAAVDATTAQVAESKARLAALRKDLDAKKVAASQAQAARKREDENLANMKKTLADAKLAEQTYKDTANKSTTTGSAEEKRRVDAQAKDMSAKVATLERNIKALNDALVVSAV